MFGNNSQRIRTLSDSVRDLKSTLDQGINAYRASQKIVVDGQSLGVLRNIQTAIDGLNQQLQTTNAQLSSLSQRPIMGMLGGGAEAELQRLVQYIDAVTKAIAEAMSLAKN